MLAGRAVVAIWNDIEADARAGFHAWHLGEHIPERVGIPGFLRGRRLIAADPATQPEFFTLYEAEDMAVLRGPDYAARLNAPTEGTKRITARFRNTSRALAEVIESAGPGVGGTMLTLRFAAAPAACPALAALARQAAAGPRVSGAHLCAGDPDASGVRSAESAGRTDLLAPPAWFLLIEAADPAALADVVMDAALRAAGVHGAVTRGMYRLEYLRGKTAFAP